MTRRTLEEFLTPGGPMRVIAHRGFSGRHPENTLAAFRAALDLEPDMVELDVTWTRDRRLVVIHDDTLDRTTDGEGPVRETDFERVRALDAGSWFGEAFAGERVPTLAEVLELTHGRTLVNVEIKEEVVGAEAAGGIVEKVLEEVHAARVAQEVVISSFEPRALVHAREISPEIARSSLFDEEKHAGLSTVEIMDGVGSRGFSPGRKEVTPEMVAECHDHGRIVTVYTVNDPDEMRRMIDMGVDGLFTDRPDVLIEVLSS